MTTVKDIENAVAALRPTELLQFRAWFDAFDAVRFDERIADDVATGRLDALADEAIHDARAGRVRDL